MAYQDYRTMTPASGAADALQEILTSKRLEKRQDAQDALNAQNVQSEIASRAEQADTNKMYRQAYADQRTSNIAETTRKATQDQNEEKALAAFAQGPEFSAWDPKYQSAYKVALASGDRATVKTLISRMLTPDNPKNTLVAQNIIDHTGKLIPAKDPVTGERIMVPQGTQPISYTNAPQPPQDHGTLAGPYLENGVAVPGKFYVMQNGKMTVQEAGSGTLGAKPNASSKGPVPLIKSSEANMNAKLRGKAAPKPGILWGSNPAKPEDVAAYKGHTQTTIANTATTPRVHMLATNILQDPNSSQYSPEEIVNIQGKDLTQQERDALMDILGALK